MDKEITVEEVLAAIKQAPMGKALGPDGFMTLCYKKFASIVASPLTLYFKAIQNGGPIDVDSNRALITLIPKPNKDHSNVANYHPIYLINTNRDVTVHRYS